MECSQVIRLAPSRVYLPRSDQAARKADAKRAIRRIEKNIRRPPAVFRLKSYELHISPFGEWDKDREHMGEQLAQYGMINYGFRSE